MKLDGERLAPVSPHSSEQEAPPSADSHENWSEVTSRSLRGHFEVVTSEGVRWREQGS